MVNCYLILLIIILFILLIIKLCTNHTNKELYYKKNIYILANNTDIAKNKKLIDKINKKIQLKKNDFIVRLNMNVLKDVFNGETTHHYFRYCGSIKTGKPCLHMNPSTFDKNKYKNIVAGYIIMNKLFENKRALRKLNDYFEKHIAPVKKENNIYIDNNLYNLETESPSTGLISVQHFTNKYPNANIKLIGFSITNKVWKHAMGKEKEKMKKMKNVEFMKF